MRALPWIRKLDPARMAGAPAELRRILFGYPVVRGALGSGANRGGRALLVYLTTPFRGDGILARELRLHNNRWQTVEIAQLLKQMGFAVDVADYRDASFVPDRHYDLLVGLGRPVVRCARMLPSDSTKIYIATGCQGRFANHQVERRLTDLERRRGVRLRSRVWSDFDPADYRLFDVVACIGNAATAATFHQFHDRIVSFDNHAQSGIGYVNRDFSEARRGFLFLGSSDQVLKGLDLVLEVFARRPELELHVCSPFHREREFMAHYRHELFATPNIHAVGVVDIFGRAFRRICERSAFMILPSATEGQSGAVINAMAAGFIPVISEFCGLDADGFGVTLSTCEIDEIDREVARLASMPEDRLRAHSLAARRAADTQFSEAAFTRRWQAILGEALQAKSRTAPQPAPVREAAL